MHGLKSRVPREEPSYSHLSMGTGKLVCTNKRLKASSPYLLGSTLLQYLVDFPRVISHMN